MSKACYECGKVTSILTVDDRCFDCFESASVSPDKKRIAELEAEKNIAIGTLKSAYEDMWRFMPNCWDSLDAVESGLSKLTGKPEAAFAKEASKRVGVRRKRAKTTKEKLVARVEKAKAELARLREELEIILVNFQIEPALEEELNVALDPYFRHR